MRWRPSGQQGYGVGASRPHSLVGRTDRRGAWVPPWLACATILALTGVPATAGRMASAGVTAATPVVPDEQMMRLQVVLDRLGFSPGVIDGRQGATLHHAIRAFQMAQHLPATGRLDTATAPLLNRWPEISATRQVRIPADLAGETYAPLPTDPVAQAKLPALGYESLDEALAERFHTTPAILALLNPDAATPSAGASRFHAGQDIRVPNIGDPAPPAVPLANSAWMRTLTSLGVAATQPQAAAIVVGKASGMLTAYDNDGHLIAAFSATMGSRHDPLPIGHWKILGVVHNPPFRYNPALFWDARPDAKKALLPPGPNGPVGVVWIDLDKPHYGIHGTPSPETIGRAESHGCIRLTNWDAARLAQMVSSRTTVLFRP